MLNLNFDKPSKGILCVIERRRQHTWIRRPLKMTIKKNVFLEFLVPNKILFFFYFDKSTIRYNNYIIGIGNIIKIWVPHPAIPVHTTYYIVVNLGENENVIH